MSFPRYPEYTDTGVEWLGEVPAHWGALALARVTSDRCDGPFGSGLKSEHYVDEGVRVVRLQNIRREGFDATDAAYIAEDYYRTELQGHDVQAGDVLIAGLGDERNTVGRACVAPAGIEPAMVKADCFRFRLRNNRVLPEFIAAQLSAGAAWDAGMLSSGSTRSRIPLSAMASRKIAVPPLDEQRVITAFLEHETAKIDALVDEQKRLIELLKEKRQAVISHAVTKGLDPNVPMKDSGVEWLGEVPAHWDVMKFVRCLRIAEGQVDPRKSPFREMVLVAPNHVESNTGRLLFKETAEEQGADSGKYICREGDVIYSKIRPALRKACLAQEDCLCSADMYPLRAVNGLANNFLLWFMLSEPFSRLAILESERVAMPKINRDSLNEVKLAVPPGDEQEKVSLYLDGETARIDQLVANAEEGVALLQERRSALISAAVTGKIDVRGWKPASSEVTVDTTAQVTA